jgi:hypothetical protein
MSPLTGQVMPMLISLTHRAGQSLCRQSPCAGERSEGLHARDEEVRGERVREPGVVEPVHSPKRPNQ